MLTDMTAFAGSVATADRLIRNMVNVGVPLYSAVKMASLTPAEILGFGKSKGKIEKGYDEDLLIFDDNINIKSVFTKGVKRV